MLSMVMVREPAALDVEDVARELAAHWPDLPAATARETEGDTISFALGNADVVLGKMPCAIPSADLEGPCETSLLWPRAAEEVARHDAHYLVSVRGDLEPIPHARLLTQATAAVLGAAQAAIGVYWGNAPLVLPKDLFLDFAKEILPESPPLHLWVDFRVGPDEGGRSAGFTSGMKALGHMELEAQRAPEEPTELHDRLLALAGYLIENGAVIRDGDTVGGSADERIRVTFADSAFGRRGRVMRLDFGAPAPKKPWWRPW